jgi:hypothetical protein
MNNRSIDRSGAPYVSRTVCESPAFEVGGQTIRKTGRAETLIMPRRCSMCSRVPSESRIYTWTGNRYFGSSKTSSSCHRLLAVAAFSRSRHFMPVCVSSRTGSVIHNLEQQMPVFTVLFVQLKSCFALLIYCHRAQQISEPWGLAILSRWATQLLRERERESCSIDSTVLLYYGHV